MNGDNSQAETLKDLKMCFITWNMHGKTPDIGSIKLLFEGYNGYDIYVLGTEECLRSIALSIVYWSKSSWEQDVSEVLGSEYQIVTSSTLSAIHIIAFARKNIIKDITGIGYSYVKSGLMNMVGNKGAVCIWFKIKQAAFMFINCHLASGKSNNERRLLDFNHILDTFEGLSFPYLFGKSFVLDEQMTMMDMFSLCVYMGDFNWRIEKDVDFIQANMTNLENLLPFDQYQLSTKKDLNPRGFIESAIGFSPTYKYEHESTSQHLYKGDERLPGWTDRIFYRINSMGISGIQFKNYTALQNITVSDHKPVILECYIAF